MNKVNETLSASDKCRRTKLSKKSSDELIDIILRKDDSERRHSKQIKTYKKLQTLNEKRVETLKATIENQENINKSLEQTVIAKDATINTLNKNIDSKDARINYLTEGYDNLCDANARAKRDLRYATIAIAILTAALVVAIVL